MGKLTALKIRSLIETGRYSDGDGLFLEINGKGAASWVLRVQNKGKRQDIGLGSLKAVSLKDAREAAFLTRQKIAQGIDPVAERKQERQVIPTFRKAAEMVHEEHKEAWKNGKHQDQWISTLKSYAFPKMGDRLVSEIEGPLIRDVLAPIWLTKPETARRVRQRIGTVLDWSYARGFRATEAPMRSLSKGLPRQPKKENHFAALPYAGVPNFLEKLGERGSVGRVALEALILTATRSGEIRGATWSELDLEAALWTIPAERMKMGRVHVVPLAPEAVAVFERAKTFKVGASDLVFPGQNVKKPLSDMTLLKILRDMDLAVTVHGFRSAFRDWVAEQTDYSGEIAEAALAHTVSNKVEAAYRRTDFLEKRRLLMREWVAFCKKTPPPSAESRDDESKA
ncbi:integrase arm-type DNA-binding domain-containing protein [Sphingomonas sanguinis]|uniref:tyrosine-type recombinase/integrase n=1 Tax=Sphingomonas sanguinis TaxID=33051 RepID=UPI001C596DE3|nr:site-specific integrase [Sphingomonas sanguinis]QXT35365.1 integrase arm-type DNA-binding domain-containing protein [Sphingomonas sanguinis]